MGPQNDQTTASAGTTYLLPSPAGAMVAIGNDRGPVRNLLRAVLRSDVTIAYSPQGLSSLAPLVPLERSRMMVADLGARRLVEFHRQPYRLGDTKLEIGLPRLLRRLSETGRGLLADSEGFLVSAVGFEAEQSIRLAAEVVELVAFDQRWRATVRGPGPVTAVPWWCMVGSGSDPDVHVLVLTVDRSQFALIVEGDPKLSDPAIVWLVWALCHRYDSSELVITTDWPGG